MSAAREAGQRSLACGGYSHDSRFRSERPPAACDCCMCHVARRGGGSQRRTELVQVLAAFQIDEFGECQASPLDGLGRRAGDGEQEAPVRVRDPRSWFQCTTTAPMV